MGVFCSVQTLHWKQSRHEWQAFLTYILSVLEQTQSISFTERRCLLSSLISFWRLYSFEETRPFLRVDFLLPLLDTSWIFPSLELLILRAHHMPWCWLNACLSLNFPTVYPQQRSLLKIVFIFWWRSFHAKTCTHDHQFESDADAGVEFSEMPVLHTVCVGSKTQSSYWLSYRQANFFYFLYRSTFL